GFVQEAIGFAVIAPLDYSAGWGSGSRCDACQLERNTVDGIDVPAGSRQDDWPVGSCAVEVLPGRLPPFGHGDLVEAPAHEPLPGRQLSAAIADCADQRFKAARPPEIEHLREQVPNLPYVGVGVSESWNNAAAAQIDDSGVYTGLAQKVASGANLLDASIAKSHGGRIALVRSGVRALHG